MKKRIRKWTLGLLAFVLIVVGTFVGVLLNPGMLYAHQTQFGGFTVYHSGSLAPEMAEILSETADRLARSELYDANWEVDICLNDGSRYPSLVEQVQGAAFGFGFYNKVVLLAEVQPARNAAVFNEQRWNLTELLTHEVVHTYQYHFHGFWGTNPIAGHANWKWEGYPEYVARQSADQRNLLANWRRWERHQADPERPWGIVFADGTVSPADYYLNWMLTQYCLEVKDMAYAEWMADTTPKPVWEAELSSWAACAAVQRGAEVRDN